MPFGKYETPKLPTTPTFLQYIKTIGKGVEGKTRFQIDVIWLPGKFDNLTLQTHAFRYLCDPNHPLYAEIPAYLSSRINEDSDPRLSIVIDCVKDKTIDLTEDIKVMGRWTSLGENAYKFKTD